VAIAGAYLAASAYLGAVGLLKLLSPDSVSLSLGAGLLHGLEVAGPYAFLLAAALGAIVAAGLWRLSRLARRAAILIPLAGLVLLIPKVSADTSEFSWRFVFAALAVIVRVMIVWYLWQGWTAEKFVRR
jgi:hypothetical protein